MSNPVHRETLEIKMRMAMMYQRLRNRFDGLFYSTFSKAINGDMTKDEVVRFDGLGDDLHINYHETTDGDPCLLVFSTHERGKCTSVRWTRSDTPPTRFYVQTPGQSEPLDINSTGDSIRELQLMVVMVMANHYFPQLDLLHYYSPAEHAELVSGPWSGTNNDG